MVFITAKTPNSSFTNKVLIGFFLIIILIILYYCILYNKISPCSFQLLASSESLVPQNISSHCQLSLNESDGWFCELDTDWKRRKALYHIQDKRNRATDIRSMFFQHNWEPTLHCEFDRRIGSTGDGGKWVCDIHRFKSVNKGTKLIYSFGSHGEFSFEKALKQELPHAEIHTFDMNIYKCPDNVCIFHRARLGNDKKNDTKSLLTIINELNHTKREIDILKVDIEGSEFDLFEELFQSSTNNQSELPYIRQILFEIHLGRAKNLNASQNTHHLFELFRLNNYAIFHKEVNLYDPQDVFEYALIRLNRAFFITSN